MYSLLMALPFQIKYSTPSLIPTSHCPSLLRVTSLITTTTKSHPNRAKRVVVNSPLSSDPTLQSTWTHRFWVVTGCTTVFASFAKSIIGGFDSHIWLEPAIAGFAGYMLADLGSGVYHWAMDNYGDESTPIVGTHVKDSQDHHMCPWAITRRQFANNLHFLARGITLTVLPLDFAFNDHVVHGFVSTFSFCVLFCPQFHAWAHGTKRKLPTLVVVLQDMGLLVSRTQHMIHHRGLYNNNYCVVSGAWNKVLDENNVFEALEMVLYFKMRVRPRSWTEPHSE